MVSAHDIVLWPCIFISSLASLFLRRCNLVNSFTLFFLKSEQMCVCAGHIHWLQMSLNCRERCTINFAWPQRKCQCNLQPIKCLSLPVGSGWMFRWYAVFFAFGDVVNNSWYYPINACIKHTFAWHSFVVNWYLAVNIDRNGLRQTNQSKLYNTTCMVHTGHELSIHWPMHSVLFH